ncbi:unnamed protein product [Toxocara canis]|uniref:CUE domain-containing protein n=1 Tax=Toxocara canis TaxID=6265 RepID=A0A183UTU2_TOXCA|nr:unnamed protein product [Toxocara canis]
MAEGSTSSECALPINELFIEERWPSCVLKRCVLFAYAPIGVLVLLFRLLIGLHVFVTACVLRKTMLLRCTVLRVMSSILGVVVLSGGPARGWDRKTPVLVANHLTVLDHMAVDLIEPCILPSVWNIPNLLRWCLGYADLGARQGRAELVRQARDFCATSAVPVLTFPEGAMTSGRRGLLKFSSWPFEVSDTVQPVLISVYRPLFGDVAHSVLGGAWWQDVLYFLFVPLTIIKVRWLSPMRRRTSCLPGEQIETTEQFAQRVAELMANKLGILATPYTSHDAVDEAKRHLSEVRQRSARRAIPTLGTPSGSQSFSRRRAHVSAAQLDSLAMTIKQAFPAISLITIRDDLEVTQDGNVTCERIASGMLSNKNTHLVTGDMPGGDGWAVSADPMEWRKTFMNRKWAMIEANRAKYLKRINDKLNAISQLQEDE